MSQELAQVVRSLAEALREDGEKVSAQVMNRESAVLETLSKHVGEFAFRRMIPSERRLTFHLELAGKEGDVVLEANERIVSGRIVDEEISADVESLVQDVPTKALARAGRRQVRVAWPDVKERFRNAFDMLDGGVEFVFVGQGFAKYIQEQNVVVDGRIGKALIVTVPHQADRDIFLVGRLDGPVTNMNDIPVEKLGHVLVIHQDPSMGDRAAKGKSGYRMLSLDEQRKFFADMEPGKRNQELAVALENVRDSTARSTIRNLFPTMNSDVHAKMLAEIRRIRPCKVENEDPTRPPPKRSLPAPSQDGKIVASLGKPIFTTTVDGKTNE